jgi:DNA-binding response OmpR family regulator
LSRADDFPFEIVLCDLGLPDGSGFDLMTRLRLLQPACFGIAISGFGMEADIQRSLQSGFLLHLTKPLNMRSLDEALRKIDRRPPVNRVATTS